MAELLEIKDLSLDDESGAILSSVSITVCENECVAIVGESGCGKTMTVRSLLNTLPDDATITGGSITFSGHNVLSMKAEERRTILYSSIGFVAQNTTVALHPLLKLSKQMTDFSPLPKKEALEKAKKLLSMLGIADPERVLSSYPEELSGGQRQRAGIGIALMKDDIKLLIADEPTSALDAHIRRQTEDLYLNLRQKAELSFLLISHDLGFVHRIADRIYVMYAGRVVEEGSCDEIFSNPIHPYTRALISLSTRGWKKGEMLDEIGGTVSHLERENLSCAFSSRCVDSSPACLDDVPYRKIGETHYVRCVL